MDIKLIERLDINTGINWWNTNREKINEVIDVFHDWQIKNKYDSFEMKVLQARIDLCREYGKSHSFSEWQYEILDTIEEYINEYKNQ